MRVWKDSLTLEQMNQRSRGTIHDSLGIQFVAIGDDFLEATMPVDQRTWQPTGMLHGGASVVLAESLGSIASVLVVGVSESVVVGVEINASHLRGIREGTVTGRVTPVRLGKSLHVWEIRIRESSDLNSPLICISRLTVMVRKR
jgi:1,4-dihydroxy-2-naphthoyl-CoA hydrolase